ncbi:MAG TPA: glycosyltransferase [Chromatiaceae bacterium]|nr:glycosyltransferase [Chromatiaceae bacterium]
MRFPQARLLVFARKPALGKVKTRIAVGIGEVAALALYRKLLRDTLRRLCTARLAPLECWCLPDCGHPDFDVWRTSAGMACKRQRGGDLGERMLFAAESALREASFVVLLGTDCPRLDADYLNDALERLSAGAEMVIGPALDGGYVLLGMRRADRRLFSDMPWGSDQVYAITMRRALALGYIVEELEALADIDEPGDLVSLPGWDSPSPTDC